MCRESQAPCTPQFQALRRFGHEFNGCLRLCDGFVAAQTMNSTTVSGPAQPHDELRRQSQAFCTSPHNTCGTSQALCAPTMNFADSLRLSAPARITFAERLRLCADPCQNSQALRPPRRPALAPCMLRQSQALRTPHAELCRQSQALRVSQHSICGTPQALCTPMMNCADSLRLSAPALIRFVERLRRCAPP